MNDGRNDRKTSKNPSHRVELRAIHAVSGAVVVVAVMLTACGAASSRPRLPPPEYEEDIPAAADSGTGAGEGDAGTTAP